MTYNWNNMVPITVPTGTNGWLYSGELTINGVKVRFPVGVPTSVPEPAAVLLKKMIELEQEEDANTAKPQNHYVGDVTIPAGKTLTLEKGAKFVDNSGGSAGGGIMYVNVTSIGELTTEIDGTMRADLTLDKSYGEVQAAFDAGNYIICKVDGFMEIPMMIIPLTSVLHDSYMAFAYGASGAFIDVFWEINGTPVIRASMTE